MHLHNRHYWRVLFLLLFLTRGVCLSHLLDVKPSAWSSILLSFSPFARFSLLSILRISCSCHLCRHRSHHQLLFSFFLYSILYSLHSFILLPSTLSLFFFFRSFFLFSFCSSFHFLLFHFSFFSFLFSFMFSFLSISFTFLSLLFLLFSFLLLLLFIYIDF